MKKVELAVTKNGKKYMVMMKDFERQRVYCWGEVASTKGLSARHYPRKAFEMGAVELVWVDRTPALLHELWLQSNQALRDQGHAVTVHLTRSGNYKATIYPINEKEV